MRKGFLDYLGEAFNAKPFGMWLPPNWAGLAAFGLLGLLNPGFWILGAGIELGYLYMLATHPRFQRWVDGKAMAASRLDAEEKVAAALASLDPTRLNRFEKLRQRCTAILSREDFSEQTAEKALQAQGLDRLLWLYLRLLRTQQSLSDLTQKSDASVEQLARRAAAVASQMAAPGIDDGLRRSLAGQHEILERRVSTLREAEQKLVFTQSEITRVEEQVRLIEDQSRLAAAPDTISEQIDSATATLDETSSWIKSQQRIYDGLADLIDEPPQVLATGSNSQTQ